ncbi:MAG TPA: hypothetical protein VGG34_01340 [Opitutaceae bacterium]|jgi:hypothetical protein
MKLPAFISKLFGAASPSTEPETATVAQNERGGYSVQTPADKEPLGNYATREAATKVAENNGYRALQVFVDLARPPEYALRYVAMRSKSGVERYFFTIDPATHFEIAQAFSKMGDLPVAAGFVSFGPDGTKTFGESIGLKMGPRPEDRLMIEDFAEVTAKAGRASVRTFRPRPLVHA